VWDGRRVLLRVGNWNFSIIEIPCVSYFTEYLNVNYFIPVKNFLYKKKYIYINIYKHIQWKGGRRIERKHVYMYNNI